MLRLLAALLGIALSAGACTYALTGPSSEPLPSPPSPPEGWRSAGSFGSTQGAVWGGMELPLAAGQAAIHATCRGSGDLVVVVGNGPGPRTSVVMACGETGDVADGRWVLPDPVAAGTQTFSAVVVEGLGNLRHPSYQVSIEQPAP